MAQTLANIIGSGGVFVDGDWVETKDQDPNGDVRLIQLADIGIGSFLDKSARFMTSAKAAALKCTLLEPGDILIARMPDPIGRACVFPGAKQPCVTVVDVCILRPANVQVDTSWLVHLINSTGFRRQIDHWITGTTRKRISRSNLAKCVFSLPPLREQTRVATALDQAETIRLKRDRAINLADQLQRSVFLDMFAGPKSDEWETKSVADVAYSSKGSIRTGPFGSQLLHSEFVDEGVAVLGIDNAVQNTFRWAKPRFISEEKYAQLKRYTVLPGDVLITIMGTCGRCAIVPPDCPTAINTKHLCCITLNHDICIPEYLHSYFLWHPVARRYLMRATKGAIMDGLNMGIIKDLPVICPPIDLQIKHREVLVSLACSKEKMSETERASTELFESLAQSNFQSG